LAEKPLLDAALSVRDEGGRTGDVRSLFHRVGSAPLEEMSFEVEMIVPAEGLDDLGQPARATSTFLRYELVLAYRGEEGYRSVGGLELLKEQLTHINVGEAHEHLWFPHSYSRWRKSAVRGHRTAAFISTEGSGPDRKIKVHQDTGSAGKPRSYLARTLPRTALSAASNAAEGPTVTMARREMQSWRLLQLEPSSLRRPDLFTAPTKLATDGANLAATLHHLAHDGIAGGPSASVPARVAESQVYARVANRLAELIDDVRSVCVDRDDRRELLTLQVTDRDGTTHPARALSDGTLRFLALAVLELDPRATGLLCLEEPENGIHPTRIPAMRDLLKGITTNVQEPVGEDNPLRQAIVNTHSPAFVSEMDDQDLLVAELREAMRPQDESRFKQLALSCLPNTWRARARMPIATRGRLLAYLNPVSPKPEQGKALRSGSSGRASSGRRVADREDLQMFLPGWPQT